MAIDTVILDLDETLVMEYATVEAAFRAVCALAESESARAGRSLDPHRLYEAIRGVTRELWHGNPGGEYARAVGLSSWEALRADFVGDDPRLAVLRAWAPSYRRAAWTRALAEQAVADAVLAARLGAAYRREMAAPPLLYPDAVPALESLRGRYRLGLLTNGLPELQRPKIEGTGLARYFSAIVVSGEVGVGKPDPAPFSALLGQLQVGPEEAVMVGNSLHSDIAGAQAAGVHSIWVRRPTAELADGIVPDAEIGGLADLGTALKAIDG